MADSGHDAATPAGCDWRRLRPSDCGIQPIAMHDRYSARCRDGASKTQDSRGVDGRTATGLDARSRMMQESRGPVHAFPTSPQPQQQQENRVKGSIP